MTRNAIPIPTKAFFLVATLMVCALVLWRPTPSQGEEFPQIHPECAKDADCCRRFSKKFRKRALSYVSLSCEAAQSLRIAEIDRRLDAYDQLTCSIDGFDLKNRGLVCLLQARMQKTGLGPTQAVDGQWGSESWRNAECAVRTSNGTIVGKDGALDHNGRALFASWLEVLDGIERNPRKCRRHTEVAVANKGVENAAESLDKPVAPGISAQSASAGPVPRPRPNPKRGDAPMTVASLPPPSTGCADVNQETDPDFVRNRSAILNAGLCLRHDRVSENGFDWSFQILTNPRKPAGPYWAILHDNENSAFSAAVHAVAKFGGGLVAIDGPESRFFKGQDPNRNFGTTSADARRCSGQRAPAPKYVRTLLKHLRASPQGHYFALHSNAPGFAGDQQGGSGHISAARPASAIMRGFMTRGGGSGDNAVLVAGTERYGRGTNAEALIKRLRSLKLNVIYEHVTRAKNDCSLSNFLMLEKGVKLGQYFNIEVRHGDTRSQIRMIDTLLNDYLGY